MKSQLSDFEMLLLLSTHSLDPCLWGESYHPAFGPPASVSLHLASSSITPAGSVHKSKMMCVVCVDVKEGHSGDGCVLTSTLCKYDLRKADLLVMSWTRVRQVMRGSISAELLMCGGGVRSILLLPIVARCLETIDI